MTDQQDAARVTACLCEAYEAERLRLLALADGDDPQGEYRSAVFGDGSSLATALLIGEAPGAEETKQGKPFVGKAGKQLDALFALFGVSRESVYISNVVKYRPVVRSAKTVRNRTPLPAEVKAALALLNREVELIAPRVILTLGNTPLRAVYQLAGEKAPTIGEAHGAPQTLALCKRDVTLIPLYHPASGIYNRALVAVMEQDARRAGEVLREKR